jgi:hypothetical protein
MMANATLACTMDLERLSNANAGASANSTIFEIDPCSIFKVRPNAVPTRVMKTTGKMTSSSA